MFLLLFGASCSSVEVFTEKMEMPPVKEYQSFVLIPEFRNFQAYGSEFHDALLRDELTRKLEANGMELNRENPEMVIRYHTQLEPKEKESYNYNPFWGGGAMYNPMFYDPFFMNRAWDGPTQTRQYGWGQIILDFIDPQANKMIMRATAVGEVNSEKGKTKKIKKSVDKILDKFYNHVRDYRTMSR